MQIKIPRKRESDYSYVTNDILLTLLGQSLIKLICVGEVHFYFSNVPHRSWSKMRRRKVT